MSLPSIFFTESSRNIGGQELQLLQQMEELKDIGFNTYLFCKKKSQIAQVVQNRHLTHIKLPFKNALDIYSVVEIYRQAKKIKPLVIVCHSGHDAAIGSWVKVLLGLSGQKISLLRMRTYQPGIPGSFFYRYIFDKACTPSQYLRRILLGNPKIPSSKLEVLYPGIDFDRLNSSSQKTLPDHLLEWLSRNPGPVIAHGAILRGEKNHSFMLGVIKKLTLQQPDVRYVIAGHGPMEPELRNKVMELQLERNVYFAGMLDSIGPLLKISTLAVLPSTYEPLGMFQIEAQYMKVPVVVSDVGGIPETVIDGDSGYVLSLNDDDIWVESLNSLLMNQLLREEMGKKGRDFVVQRFSKKRNTEELVNIIQSL